MEDLDMELDEDFGISDSDMNLEMPEIGESNSLYEDLGDNTGVLDSELERSDCGTDVFQSNDKEYDAQTSSGEVCFKGYTQSEINSKYHKAELDYGHAKADYQRHMDLAKTGTMPNNDELAHAREAYRRMEVAQKEMYKWKYTHPDKK